MPRSVVTCSVKRLLALLLAAFVWLQFAGLAHKYLHTAYSSSAHAGLATVQFAQMFSAHEGQPSDDKTCQLFDLACADLSLAQVAAALAASLATELTFAFLTSSSAAAQIQAYLARAPPL